MWNICNWFTNYLDQSKLGKKYTLWLAEYFPMPNPTFKDAEARRTTYMTDNFTYWQFASDGLITGTKGNTDLNLGYDIFEK